MTNDIHVLYLAIDNRTFNEKFSDQKIAKHIAPYWNNLGNRLRVRHLDNINSTNSPTEDKYKDMLKTWIYKQTCSKHKIAIKLHEALIKIDLIRVAEDFEKVALKSSKDDRNNNDDVDDGENKIMDLT